MFVLSEPVADNVSEHVRLIWKVQRSHARVAWFYGGSCTPAGSQAVVTLHWRCTGYFFQGDPLKRAHLGGPRAPFSPPPVQNFGYTPRPHHPRGRFGPVRNR